MIMDLIHFEQIAKLLQMACDEFSNHGCNDLPSDFFSGWTDEDKAELVKVYNEWTGETITGPAELIGDYELMGLYAEQINKEIKEHDL